MLKQNLPAGHMKAVTTKLVQSQQTQLRVMSLLGHQAKEPQLPLLQQQIMVLLQSGMAHLKQLV